MSRRPAHTGEPLLFAPRPGANRTRTSRRAAELAEPKAPTCRQRILAHLRDHAGGFTHEEIANDLNIRLDTVKPRVHELGEMGLVKALAATRLSSAGVPVLAFVAAELTLGRPIEPWPLPRVDWKTRAIDLQRQLEDARRVIERLTPHTPAS